MQRFSSVFLSTALLISVLLSATGGFGQEKSVPSTDSNDEYQVYAAVLESLQRSGKVSHPLIADQTSTFACHGIGICNGFVMGGCNGLLGPDESPESRMRIVRQDLPTLEAKISSDFITLNQKCSVVHDKIPLSSKYYMFNPSSGPKSGSTQIWYISHELRSTQLARKLSSMLESCLEQMQRTVLVSTSFC
jgi:hypothetical protein